MEFGIHYMPMPIMEVSLKSGQKLNLNAPNGPFGPVGDQKVLPDRSIFQVFIHYPNSVEGLPPMPMDKYLAWLLILIICSPIQSPLRLSRISSLGKCKM